MQHGGRKKHRAPEKMRPARARVMSSGGSSTAYENMESADGETPAGTAFSLLHVRRMAHERERTPRCVPLAATPACSRRLYDVHGGRTPAGKSRSVSALATNRRSPLKTALEYRRDVSRRLVVRRRAVGGRDTTRFAYERVLRVTSLRTYITYRRYARQNDRPHARKDTLNGLALEVYGHSPRLAS